MTHTSFLPDRGERLARARADLRMGVPVVLTLGARAVLVLAAETLTAPRLEALHSMEGAVELVITARRAATLKVPVYDGDLARVLLPSAVALPWVRAMADPSEDLQLPMKGPLHPMRGGEVAGHRAAIALAKQARLLPAVVVRTLAAAAHFADTHHLGQLPHHWVGADRAVPAPLQRVVSAALPLGGSPPARLHIFRPRGGGQEHSAIEIGRPARDAPVLVRLHSACFTGDVLGSLKCDCGPQLRRALALIGQAGAGIVLYLNQEGRGIGLANKMRAYSLQDQGFDTVEANHRLGFEDDERDFHLGAGILRQMGFGAVDLLTNNPRKIAMMRSAGIVVRRRVPLRAGETPQNAAYLATKIAKSGHLP
ncbi:MAG: GTP cyclohydrolase II [Rhodobacteraceae bacterium]|nr:GTP cyclohydrolase II [Paracoccaceae bacterium]